MKIIMFALSAAFLGCGNLWALALPSLSKNVAELVQRQVDQALIAPMDSDIAYDFHLQQDLQNPRILVIPDKSPFIKAINKKDLQPMQEFIVQLIEQYYEDPERFSLIKRVAQTEDGHSILRLRRSDMRVFCVWHRHNDVGHLVILNVVRKLGQKLDPQDIQNAKNFYEDNQASIAQAITEKVKKLKKQAKQTSQEQKIAEESPSNAPVDNPWEPYKLRLEDSQNDILRIVKGAYREQLFSDSLSKSKDKSQRVSKKIYRAEFLKALEDRLIKQFKGLSLFEMLEMIQQYQSYWTDFDWYVDMKNLATYTESRLRMELTLAFFEQLDEDDQEFILVAVSELPFMEVQSRSLELVDQYLTSEKDQAMQRVQNVLLRLSAGSLKTHLTTWRVSHAQPRVNHSNNKNLRNKAVSLAERVEQIMLEWQETLNLLQIQPDSLSKLHKRSFRTFGSLTFKERQNQWQAILEMVTNSLNRVYLSNDDYKLNKKVLLGVYIQVHEQLKRIRPKAPLPLIKTLFLLEQLEGRQKNAQNLLPFLKEAIRIPFGDFKKSPLLKNLWKDLYRSLRFTPDQAQKDSWVYHQYFAVLHKKLETSQVLSKQTLQKWMRAMQALDKFSKPSDRRDQKSQKVSWASEDVQSHWLYALLNGQKAGNFDSVMKALRAQIRLAIRDCEHIMAMIQFCENFKTSGLLTPDQINRLPLSTKTGLGHLNRAITDVMQPHLKDAESFYIENDALIFGFHKEHRMFDLKILSLKRLLGSYTDKINLAMLGVDFLRKIDTSTLRDQGYLWVESLQALQDWPKHYASMGPMKVFVEVLDDDLREMSLIMVTDIAGTDEPRYQELRNLIADSRTFYAEHPNMSYEYLYEFMDRQATLLKHDQRFQEAKEVYLEAKERTREESLWQKFFEEKIGNCSFEVLKNQVDNAVRNPQNRGLLRSMFEQATDNTAIFKHNVLLPMDWSDYLETFRLCIDDLPEGDEARGDCVVILDFLKSFRNFYGVPDEALELDFSLRYDDLISKYENIVETLGKIVTNTMNIRVEDDFHEELEALLEILSLEKSVQQSLGDDLDELIAESQTSAVSA